MMLDLDELPAAPFGAMVVSVKVPTAAEPDGGDPRPAVYAHRTRRAVSELATACFARGLQLLVHADAEILPALWYVARGFPRFLHGASHIVAASNESDPEVAALASRTGGAVELLQVPAGVTADESRFERFDRLLRWDLVRCVFFVGGGDEVFRDGELALRRGRPHCYALAATGPGARNLVTTFGARMAGNVPGLDGELGTTVSTAFAISIGLQMAGL